MTIIEKSSGMGAATLNSRRTRRGMASVLAMLFLLLFSVLAVGFIGTVSMSGQISRNERGNEQSRMAADSGMSFIRYQLGSMVVPQGTNSANLLANIATVLGQQLNNTANMGSSTVQVGNNAIDLPSPAGWISADATLGTKFEINITQVPNTMELIVTARGAGPAAAVSRGVQLHYIPSPGNSSILNYGVAAQGPIVVTGNAAFTGINTPSQGSILSATAQATPLTLTGNDSLSGDFSDTNATGAVSLSGNQTIAGYPPSNPNFSQHVHKGIPPPTFPTVDTSPYLPYVNFAKQCTTCSGIQTFLNAYIPANSNPTISGITTIQGVLYIQTPNHVTFSGNLTIQGVIVVQNSPTGSSNSINFTGNFSASGMPASVPVAEQALTGSFLLAPSFAVTMTGNFGTIGGSMVADQFTFTGNAGGTVDGSVLALKDVPLNLTGNNNFSFGHPVNNNPTGLTFPGGFAPVQGSYLEVP